MELELARRAALVGRLEREAPQVDGQALDRLLEHPLAEGVDPPGDVGAPVAQLGEVAPGPVLTPAVASSLGAAATRPEQGDPRVLVAGLARRGGPRGPGRRGGRAGDRRRRSSGRGRAHLVGLVEQRHQRLVPGLDLDGRAGGLGDGQVPVLVEGEGDQAQVVDADPCGRGEEERVLDSRVGEQPVDEAAPPVVEGDGRRHLVEHLDAWGQPRLDGVLDQQPLGEAVERADGGAVELAQCLDAVGGDGRCGAGRAVAGPRSSCPWPVSPWVSRARVELVVEAPAHAVAQLGCGLLGERDGRDLVEARGAGDDQLGDALDEGARLPRPGGRLHEQRLVERLRDAVARRLVGRIGRRGVGRRGVDRRGHAGTSSGSASAA